MTCIRCKHGTAKRFGTYRRKAARIQRYRCSSCSTTFAEPTPKPLGSHTLEIEKAVKIITLLTEGMSIRAASRITGVHKTTILSLLVTVGNNCRSVFDRHVVNIRPRFIQADELWTFVQKKSKHVLIGDPDEWGDAYLWIAIDPETKAVLSYRVGKRTAVDAYEFIGDLSTRVKGRFQITTDGLRAYIPAIEDHFGGNASYAQLIKVFSGNEDNRERYSPGDVVEVVPEPVSGNPDPRHICTSHVERVNGTVRCQARRFTRLTNAFSRKLRNLRAAVHIFMMWYNFIHVHGTLRVTPAMEAGITDHVWSVEELLNAGASA